MSPDLRVAQCCLTRSWGGMEMQVLAFVGALAERGCRSVGMCLPDSPLERELRARGLEALTVDRSRDYVAPRAVAVLRRWMGEERPHVLHAHRSTDLWLLRQAAWRLRSRPRLLLTSRILSRATRKRGLLHAWLYRGVDRVIALSELSRRALLDCVALTPAQIEIIPDGIDLDPFPVGEERARVRQSSRASLGVTERTELIGVVGRLDPKKGQDDAIRALALLERPAAELVLIGAETAGEPGEEKRLRELAAELGVANRVRFLGHRQDIPALLSALDVFLLPSHEEAFGDVLLEAMAAGVPVIATRAGGPPEILDHGRIGLLVEPRNPEDFAAAITKVLEDAGEIAGVVAAARRRVEILFAFPAIVDRTIDLYRRLLDDPVRAEEGQ